MLIRDPDVKAERPGELRLFKVNEGAFRNFAWCNATRVLDKTKRAKNTLIYSPRPLAGEGRKPGALIKSVLP